MQWATGRNAMRCERAWEPRRRHVGGRCTSAGSECTGRSRWDRQHREQCRENEQTVLMRVERYAERVPLSTEAPQRAAPSRRVARPAAEVRRVARSDIRPGVGDRRAADAPPRSRRPPGRPREAGRGEPGDGDPLARSSGGETSSAGCATRAPKLGIVDEVHGIVPSPRGGRRDRVGRSGTGGGLGPRSGVLRRPRSGATARAATPSGPRVESG